MKLQKLARSNKPPIEHRNSSFNWDYFGKKLMEILQDIDEELIEENLLMTRGDHIALVREKGASVRCYQRLFRLCVTRKITINHR